MHIEITLVTLQRCKVILLFELSVNFSLSCPDILLNFLEGQFIISFSQRREDN